MLLGIGNIIDNSEDGVFDCQDGWYLLYFEAPAVLFILFHGLLFAGFSI
jgi:hypothetical protein